MAEGAGIDLKLIYVMYKCINKIPSERKIAGKLQKFTIYITRWECERMANPAFITECHPLNVAERAGEKPLLPYVHSTQHTVHSPGGSNQLIAAVKWFAMRIWVAYIIHLFTSTVLPLHTRATPKHIQTRSLKTGTLCSWLIIKHADMPWIKNLLPNTIHHEICYLIIPSTTLCELSKSAAYQCKAISHVKRDIISHLRYHVGISIETRELFPLRSIPVHKCL